MDEPSVNGVTLREYVELLVDSKTNEIKVIMAERLQAVQTAYEQHGGDHKVIEKDMEHLNQLRQDVITDRVQLTPRIAFDTYKESVDKWMGLMGNQYSSFRGQLVGAGVVLALIPTVLAIYALMR